MKVKKNDWIVKVTYVTDDLRYEVKHINVLNSTKKRVLHYAESLPKGSVVCIYKLEAVL